MTTQSDPPQAAVEAAAPLTPTGSKATPAVDDRWQKRSLPGRIVRRPEFGSALVTIAMIVFFAVVAGGGGFLSTSGTAGWLNTAAELGIVAVPIALLMISGEFDLSIGSTVGASGILVAISTGQFGLPIGVSVVLALLLGGAVGLLNGLLVNKTGMPSFIVTLAANFFLLGIALGLARRVASTSTVSVVFDGPAHGIFAGKLGDFNASIFWWMAIAVVAAWILGKKPFGSWIYATGGSADSARRAGVPTARVKLLLFVTSGVAAALLGVITAAQDNAGNAVSGQGFVFQAPIVAVIGGVLLTGGYGSVLGVCFGAAIYGIVSIGLFYTGWNTDWAPAFIGVLLVLAVLANSYIREAALSNRSVRRKAATS
ncbi:ABC transporter permease [Demetria terragena]|uniref:ABC transporter permease n=1 Tax=Demetria terragena TaxID=63959 RepID=UPI000363E141|nr:ABC transporter permease [Demetria terragena]